MKKTAKLITSLVLVIVMVFAMAACGKDEKTSSSTDSSSASTEASSKTEDSGSSSTDESSSSSTEDSSSSSTDESSSSTDPGEDDPAQNPSDQEGDLASMNALEFANAMGNGTNLGNTLEAIGSARNFEGKAITDMTAYGSVGENEWGQPTTTLEIMQGIKAGGFDSIRIPIGWTKGMDNIASFDYTINEDFFSRIDTIIGYALDAGLIVIINDHWDGGWWGMFGQEDETLSSEAWKLYESMWTQIAERYKDIDERLVFEGANEELCTRLNDKINGVAGKLSNDKCYEMTNQINQKFVDIVRACGGKNENRFLLIPGYGTDVEQTCNDKYKMPTDTVNGKLLVSVHYYTPSGYCLFDGVSKWGTGSNVEEMNRLLQMMTKFTDAGYGVIIGEYGALPQNGAYKAGAELWTENFLDNCDLYGYAPMLWDCSDFYNRNTLSWKADRFRLIYSGRKAVTDEAAKKEAAKQAIDARVEEAKAQVNENRVTDDPTASVAWIMFADKDWGVMYRAGNEYDLDAFTDDYKAGDVLVTGEGTYTVTLDLTEIKPEGASLGFMAVGISNGEYNFEDYIIDIKEVKINGEVVEPNGDYYTTADDHICTRVNLYNQWAFPKAGDRFVEGVTKESATATPIDGINKIKTVEVTFDYYEEP